MGNPTLSRVPYFGPGPQLISRSCLQLVSLVHVIGLPVRPEKDPVAEEKEEKRENEYADGD